MGFTTQRQLSQCSRQPASTAPFLDVSSWAEEETAEPNGYREPRHAATGNEVCYCNRWYHRVAAGESLTKSPCIAIHIRLDVSKLSRPQRRGELRGNVSPAAGGIEREKKG